MRQTLFSSAEADASAGANGGAAGVNETSSFVDCAADDASTATLFCCVDVSDARSSFAALAASRTPRILICFDFFRGDVIPLAFLLRSSQRYCAEAITPSS